MKPGKNKEVGGGQQPPATLRALVAGGSLPKECQRGRG